MGVKEKRREHRIMKMMPGIMLVVAIILAFWIGISLLTPVMREMGAKSLEESVLARANQCFAIEGIYPTSLSYLEENYGLVVNRSDYVVVYETFAENVAPKVIVTPRDKG